ncbi:unnamed protein product [Acanthoscelides obtectus]|uniref:Uncharacterized protein n=1 Tax=Acanthoscelides obtectus TaxID=200917 RepID=A0A9P0LSG5_ACAOB|nr:unnamed protein product [Acanthoscelides obtectus]CAK1670905.1 hypothetical protein AOBTE_LOCUS27907 [Acanthoscelides obtectus]
MSGKSGRSCLHQQQSPLDESTAGSQSQLFASAGQQQQYDEHEYQQLEHQQQQFLNSWGLEQKYNPAAAAHPYVKGRSLQRSVLRLPPIRRQRRRRFPDGPWR